MNHLDDDELIDGLRSGLAHRTHGVHAPADIADGARRVAHRRAAARAVGAGVPVLAVAGLATILLTGSGGGRAHATIAPAAPGVKVTAPGARAQDTAYIIKRVKARVADRAGAVIDSAEYVRGHMSSDGTLSGLGADVAGGPSYMAPDGTVSTKTVRFYPDGSPALIIFRGFVPDRDGSGRGDQTNTTVNYRSHIYSRAVFAGVSDDLAQRTPGPNLYTTPAEVQQALQDGEVTQTGTTTVDGTPAIALSVKVPSARGARLILFVDAHTYQPLRTAETDQGFPGVNVNDWMPATADNIAMSRPSIPADYTRVKAPTYTPPGTYAYNGGSGPLEQPDTGSGH